MKNSYCHCIIKASKIFIFLSIFVFQFVLIQTFSDVALAYLTVSTEKRLIKSIVPHSKDIPVSASHLLEICGDDTKDPSIYSGNVNYPNNKTLFCYLPIPEVVTRQMDRYVASEFSIENLLYANLKIERLMREYDDLEKRSHEILEGLDVPFIHGVEYEQLLQQKASFVTLEIDRVTEQSNFIAGPELVYATQNNSTGSRKPIAAKKTFGSTHRFRFEKPGVSLSTGSSVTRGSSHKSNDANHSQPEFDASESKNIQYGVDSKDQLPRLIRVLRSLFRYLFENKIEAVLYIILIYGIGHLVFSARGKG